MKLVLLKDVKHLGKVGEEINVKAGYARNYLLPTKSALTPSEENLDIINKMKDELIKKEQDAKDTAMSFKDRLNGYNQLHKVKVKEDSNELFGSITLQNIIDKMKEDGYVIEKKQINLPLGSIKELGTYNANISLHPEVACDIEIIAEKSADIEETV
jgi:large subunit ribosomal protein L9